MAKNKKKFSEKALQAVLADARAAGKRPREAAIRLFEGMETKREAELRKLSTSPSASQPAVKRRSLPKVPVAAKTTVKEKAKPKAKAPSKPKSGYGAQRG